LNFGKNSLSVVREQKFGPYLRMLLIAIVVLVMFGRGKITNLMGEVGKGITAFKKGVSEGKEELETSVEDAAEAAKDVTPDSKKS